MIIVLLHQGRGHTLVASCHFYQNSNWKITNDFSLQFQEIVLSSPFQVAQYLQSAGVKPEEIQPSSQTQCLIIGQPHHPSSGQCKDVHNDNNKLIMELFLPDSERPTWCYCGRCRKYFASEVKCCRTTPGQCILSSDAQIHHLVLNESAVVTAINASRLALHERQWTYPNNTMRITAYRQYIYYTIGHLGKGVRVCPPNCLLWAIRDKWPDNVGYTGFKM